MLNPRKRQKTTNTMDAAAKASQCAAITAAMSGDEDSPFEPAYFHFPDNNGSIILTIDAQKTWETVASYGNRVIALLAQKGLSVERDPIFMCRVFLGGLRPSICYAVMSLHIDAYRLHFRNVFYFAQFLENSPNEAMGVMKLGGAPPKWKTNVKPGRPCMLQDDLVFYGETNEPVDAYYQRGPVRSQLKILYRR